MHVSTRDFTVYEIQTVQLTFRFSSVKKSPPQDFITSILASKALYVVKKEGYNAATNQNMTLLQAGTGFWGRSLMRRQPASLLAEKPDMLMLKNMDSIPEAMEQSNPWKNKQTNKHARVKISSFRLLSILNLFPFSSTSIFLYATKLTFKINWQ